MAEEAAAPEVLAEVPIADEANTKEDAPTTTDVEMKDEEKRGKPENKPKAGRAKAEPKEAKAAAGSRASARERKAVDHFKVEDSRLKSDPVVIMEGEGTKLSDIPNVAFHLGKISGKDEFMAMFHRLLYGKPGKATTRKKDILAFSGFVHEDMDDELEKDVDKLCKWKLDDIHKLMEALDMQRGTGSKEDKAEKVIQFLRKPSILSDKDLAAKEDAKKEAARKKREREAKKKEAAKKKMAKSSANKKAAAKKPAAKKKAAAKKAEPEDDDQDGDETKEEDAADEEEEEEEADEEEEEEAEQPTKKTKLSAPNSAAGPESPSATPQSNPRPAWEVACTNDEQKEIARAAVEIMKTVDLKEFSLKNLLDKMKDKFSKDMVEHKKLLKQVAVDFCKENN